MLKGRDEISLNQNYITKICLNDAKTSGFERKDYSGDALGSGDDVFKKVPLFGEVVYKKRMLHRYVPSLKFMYFIFFFSGGLLAGILLTSDTPKARLVKNLRREIRSLKKTNEELDKSVRTIFNNNDYIFTMNIGMFNNFIVNSFNSLRRRYDRLGDKYDEMIRANTPRKYIDKVQYMHLRFDEISNAIKECAIVKNQYVLDSNMYYGLYSSALDKYRILEKSIATELLFLCSRDPSQQKLADKINGIIRTNRF